LLQREPSGRPRLIECGSCSLTPAQQRYATVELEASAILWATVKCDHYLRGMVAFTIKTDHKPLVGAFDKPLAAMGNDRLQRIRERLCVYSFTLVWTAGKLHQIADALSRAPFFPADEESEVPVFGVFVEDPAFDFVRAAIGTNVLYGRLCEVVRAGGECPPELVEYRRDFEEYRLEDGLLLCGHRLLVPESARRKVLDLLHLGHCGYPKTKELANQLYTWPGMNNAIKVKVATCSACIALLPAQQHESVLIERAAFPMEWVAAECI
jgi:hypothetical protein